MSPRHQHQLSDQTPMTRQDVETAGAIATLNATTSHLGDRLTEGFEAMDRQFSSVNASLEKLTDHLTAQDKTLSSLEESRERTRKLVRWVGGVVATVVAALLLLLLGLKR